MEEVALSGVLVVDKPVGPTSFDVVRRVKRLLGAARAGHTGTLDPLASGVLAVCVGEAVKLQQWLTEGDKAYEGEVAFGAATDTEDAEGRVVERGDPSALREADVAAALPGFLGEIDQVPPMFSAVRMGGRRLHEAARAGEKVERPPRRVRILALHLLGFERDRGGLARARLYVRCGKGTYIRTLAADLGRALRVPAHLAALRRTAAGPFALAEAVPLDELERQGRASASARLIPPGEAVRFLPAVRLDAGQEREVRQGRSPAMPGVPEGLSRALDETGRLVAVCRTREGRLQPVRVLTPRPIR